MSTLCLINTCSPHPGAVSLSHSKLPRTVAISMVHITHKQEHKPSPDLIKWFCPKHTAQCCIARVLQKKGIF